MVDDVRVLILEDDPFARNWMAMLAARDLRTRVIGEINDPSLLISFLERSAERIDLILLDTDIPSGVDWIPRIRATLKSKNRFPRILCTGITANPRVLSQLTDAFFTGYILKEEIRNSLAWAISLTEKGYWIITDSIQALASSIDFSLPRPCIVLEGRYAVQNLTPHQAHVARLAFLFSMERRDLADELGVTEDWGYGLVSAVYEKIGLKDILANDTNLGDYLGNHSLLTSYFEKICEESEGTSKARDMETLAFHLLTTPEMREL
jgi:DNA-binding NarL/FixJ family response regulator